MGNGNIVITLGILRDRIDMVRHLNNNDSDMPMRLSIRGGSGKITQVDIDCTTSYFRIADDGTIIIDVRGRLGEEVAHG